ncbi:unnamed protein product [Effrenium voratum]|uniref:Uncharacterized protein n=1 Tax=Effrenium voratum TaxID=2562239 RepID=A0AA36NI45_9DINO|nr:unnamed protein product [Effrenium voratum]
MWRISGLMAEMTTMESSLTNLREQLEAEPDDLEDPLAGALAASAKAGLGVSL